MTTYAIEQSRAEETPHITRGPRLLLATDFDGTIAPIVSRPGDATIAPLAASILEYCARERRVAVAVLSGRDVADVRRRLGGLRAIVAGSHGLECQDVDGTMLWTARRQMPALPDRIALDLESLGFLVERKRFSIAVHFRDASPDLKPRRAFAFTSWAKEQSLELMPGRKVIEARLPGGGKRAALRAIAAHVDAARVVYAGDDVTDFDALSFAAERGRAIFVESDERSAPSLDSMSKVSTIDDLCAMFAAELVDAAMDGTPMPRP